MYGHLVARAAPSAGCWLFMWDFLFFGEYQFMMHPLWWNCMKSYAVPNALKCATRWHHIYHTDCWWSYAVTSRHTFIWTGYV